MYDTEMAYRNCIGKIAEWRSSRLLFKVPRGNITDRIWILIMGAEENLDVEKSPDEEMWLIEINKCSQCRNHLLGELSIQWSTWKEIKPEPEKFLSQNKIYS